MQRAIRLWAAVGWAGYALLPWSAVGGGGVFAGGWIGQFASEPASASGLLQSVLFGRLWLLPPALILLLPLLSPRQVRPALLLAAGLLGLLHVAAVGAAIGLRGWNVPELAAWFGVLPRRNPGLGLGAAVVAGASLMFVCFAAAARGWVKGDAFVAGTIGATTVLVALFILYPIGRLLFGAVLDADGALSLAALLERVRSAHVLGWSGVVVTTLRLGVLTAASATALALAFALIVHRTDFAGRRVLSALSVLPMITPPFVIGLALILLFGRAGVVNAILEAAFAITPSRWIYGFPGVWLAQTLALTPVAFLILGGVIEGISPSLEEAALTLRASPALVFRNVTLKLLSPGLLNAFLIVFIESLADIGNPLLLGGEMEVLSTAIYFAVVGVNQDIGRAAVLAIVLLGFTLSVFALQRWMLARRSFITITGKGDGGLRAPLPAGIRWAAYLTALPWTGLTMVVYGMVLFGGFVEKWGLRNSFTLSNYVAAFRIEYAGGLNFTGGAWNSLADTLVIAAIAAPLTATMGLTVAYLLDRQRFVGKTLFEFATMLTFAVPGTVMGIGYIYAFNRPPIELVYSGIILVLCFIFRDMTTATRAGLASLSQIDRSLDEAALTLRAGSFTTVRRVVLPLLRPAIVAALVYGFISAMTSISAVIFLTSPRYDMATVNIVGRAEVGQYGYATAYASALIVLMMLAVGAIRLVVGKRDLGRRAQFGAGG
jgi:iron(III) transport system permease protein